MSFQQVVVGNTTNQGGTVTIPGQFLLMVDGQFAAVLGSIVIYTSSPYVDIFTLNTSTLLSITGLGSVLQTQSQTTILSDTVSQGSQLLLIDN